MSGRPLGSTSKRTKPIRLTQADLAYQTGVNHRRISALIRDGTIQLGEDDKVLLKDFVQAVSGGREFAKASREMAKAGNDNIDFLAKSKRFVDILTIQEIYGEKVMKAVQVISRIKGLSPKDQEKILEALAGE